MKKNVFAHVMLSAVAVILTACGGTNPNVTTPPPAAPTATITANPTSVASGGSSVLTYSCTNSTSAVASGSWTDALSATSGTVTKNPTSTSTYTLTCNGAGGTATASATVTVTSVPPAITGVSLNCTSTSIVVGQNT